MSLKHFEELSSNNSVDHFLDVNQNKTMESFELMEPMHLDFEANDHDEQLISARSEIHDPRIEGLLLILILIFENLN